MQKSLLLAGLFLALTNLIPSVTPIARAAGSVVPAAYVAAHTAVKHSTQLLTSTTQAVKFHTAFASPADIDGLTAEEMEFVTLINSERTSRGENALVIDPLLVNTARMHSREMCDLDYFDHCSPTPGITTPMDRFLKGLSAMDDATPNYLLVGENIYYCSVFNSHYNVQYGHEALMNSPGHRANILEPRFTKVGVGVYESAGGEFWVTEMFLRDTQP
jgi:uncharacterized protein YkwD